MRKTFCDRCGNEIEDGTQFTIWTKEFYRFKFSFSRNEKERCQEIEHDICYDCQRSLWRWWAKGDTKIDIKDKKCWSCQYSKEADDKNWYCEFWLEFPNAKEIDRDDKACEHYHEY